MARKVALRQENKESQMIAEGEETDDFWQALGGKGDYESSKQDKLIHDFKNARLFYRKAGKYEEDVDYDQNDLVDDDVIILGTIEFV